MSFVKGHIILRCFKEGQKHQWLKTKKYIYIKIEVLKVDLPNRTRLWPNLAQKIRLCEIVIKTMRDSARFVKFAFV